MSRFLLLLTSLFISLSSLGQSSYTTIHVIGKIYRPDSQSFLKRGDRLSDEEKLEFQTKDAKAAVLSSDRGRYVLQPSQEAASADGALVFALKSVITPVKGRMSTRAGGINNKLDFQKKLNDGAVAWLADEMSVNVSESAYPTDDSKFFFASYDYQGEQINKKLESQNELLVFKKTDFYTVDDAPI